MSLASTPMACAATSGPPTLEEGHQQAARFRIRASSVRPPLPAGRALPLPSRSRLAASRVLLRGLTTPSRSAGCLLACAASFGQPSIAMPTALCTLRGRRSYLRCAQLRPATEGPGRGEHDPRPTATVPNPTHTKRQATHEGRAAGGPRQPWPPHDRGVATDASRRAPPTPAATCGRPHQKGPPAADRDGQRQHPRTKRSARRCPPADARGPRETFSASL